MMVTGSWWSRADGSAQRSLQRLSLKRLKTRSSLLNIIAPSCTLTMSTTRPLVVKLATAGHESEACAGARHAWDTGRRPNQGQSASCSGSLQYVSPSFNAS
ncbi:hypothetical protein FA95DRAFT_213156 [Auriscalpium vulgare]|uniref:Uncharacterized protein n=1 Tax=Auriscalpium vulgare TaxID=40419 RepID=A0ACB8RM65_9AGAM|nr:hypothetical protein FA95DRAFT_213156 [Auriscalpium vulgare]